MPLQKQQDSYVVSQLTFIPTKDFNAGVHHRTTKNNEKGIVVTFHHFLFIILIDTHPIENILK